MPTSPFWTLAHAALPTFAERGQGDVLLTWENEAHLALKEFGAGKFDIVYPPSSIYAEPPVAVIDKNVENLPPIPDRHYIIERGRAVWSGTSDELIAAPELQHRYLGI